MKPLDLEPYRATCIRCGADVFWATSAHTGAPIPVNEKPNGIGANLVLFCDGTTEDGTKILKAGVLSRGQAAGARDRGTTLYASHYRECHDTKTHRKGLR